MLSTCITLHTIYLQLQRSCVSQAGASVQRRLQPMPTHMDSRHSNHMQPSLWYSGHSQHLQYLLTIREWRVTQTPQTEAFSENAIIYDILQILLDCPLSDATSQTHKYAENFSAPKKTSSEILSKVSALVRIRATGLSVSLAINPLEVRTKSLGVKCSYIKPP